MQFLVSKEKMLRLLNEITVTVHTCRVLCNVFPEMQTSIFSTSKYLIKAKVFSATQFWFSPRTSTIIVFHNEATLAVVTCPYLWCFVCLHSWEKRAAAFLVSCCCSYCPGHEEPCWPLTWEYSSTFLLLSQRRAKEKDQIQNPLVLWAFRWALCKYILKVMYYGSLIKKDILVRVH